jgi:hypothetical protein
MRIRYFSRRPAVYNGGESPPACKTPFRRRTGWAQVLRCGPPTSEAEETHGVIQRRGPAQELRATIDRLPMHVRQGVLDGIKGHRIIAGAHSDASGGVCPMVAADAHVHWKSVHTSSVKSAQEAARAWDRYAEATGSSHTATKRQLLALTSMLEASILQEQTQSEPPLIDAITEYKRARSRDVSAPMPVPEVPVARPSMPEPVAFPSMPEPLTYAETYQEPAALPSAPEPIAAPIAAEPVAAEPVAAQPARPPRKRRDTGERDRSGELAGRDGWAWLRPFRSYDEYEETLLRALAELDTHERELHELQIR